MFFINYLNWYKNKKKNDKKNEIDLMHSIVSFTNLFFISDIQI